MCMEIPKSGDQETRRLRTVFFCVIIQRVVVSSYRFFGTKYRSHPQGSRIQRYTKTSVRNYQYSLHNNPEESSYQLIRSGAYSRTIKISSHVHILNYILILSSSYLIFSECVLYFMLWDGSGKYFSHFPSNASSLATWRSCMQSVYPYETNI